MSYENDPETGHLVLSVCHVTWRSLIQYRIMCRCLKCNSLKQKKKKTDALMSSVQNSDLDTKKSLKIMS